MTRKTLSRGLAFACALCALQAVSSLPANAQESTQQQSQITTVIPPPRIESFVMSPVNRLAPGAMLDFRLRGATGADASVRLEGVTRTIRLREVEPGSYEGTYTLKDGDHVTPESAATATLRHEGAFSTVTMDRMAAQGRPTSANAPTVIVEPGGPLPLRITSPHEHAIVPPGNLQVQGHTDPGARVHIDAIGVAPATGHPEGMSQPIYKGSTTADANGDFTFSFDSPFTAPGLRYEIGVSAEHDGQMRERHLELYQQR